ncbi:GYF domain-containing protein [Taklimakanibacter lacteus]|uniref:GYF domain-containing protein n=1 Tax=Taklimakanibacter lacteus TaxID=2268456 RepID=UPI000E671B9A
MTTTAVVHFAGALLGIALISRLPVWFLQAWREKSLLRLFAAHLFTYVIVAVISAFAQARGIDPQWRTAFVDLALPALLVFLIDTVLMLKRDSGTEGLEAHWFLHSAGKQSGPVPADAVTAALADGSLKASDWVWRAGFAEWAQISSVDLTGKDGTPQAAAADPQASGNYLHRHWQGALSLPRSYWAGGLSIAALFILPYLLLMRLTLTDHPRLIGAAVTGLWLTLLAAMLWLSVGIFRSADHHARTHPARHWGSAAKLSIVLGCLAVLSIFARLGVPQIRDFADAMSGSRQTLYALQLRRDDTELALSGPMESGLSEAVARSLMDHPRLATLALDSTGGDLNEADKLKAIVLGRGLNTYVPATCTGACVTVFAAGRTRWLSRGAFLALHRPAIADATPADLAAAAAKTKAFLESRGITAQFVDKGLAATQEAAFRPSHAELFEARLATSYATDAEVAKGGIPVREIRDAEAAVDRTALYQVIRDKHPKAHAELLAIVRDRILKNESPARMRRRVSAAIAPIVNDSISSAAEPALLAFYQMATDEAEAFARVDARSCEAFLKGDTGGFDAALLPLALQEREFQATADLIRSAGSYAGRPIEQSEVMGPLAQVVAAAQTKGFTQADFQQAIQFKLDPARNCQGTILLFRSLFVMNAPDRTALLRYMAQQATTL